ncbi:hypothetical protein AAG570_003851 [Ranatra chinensis]|uniref:EGF-like domain-containing protein n=1 Tax=Ranatra chinensis TaxID=642074 RepID=A0ABD0Y4C2_9HEMI
MYVAQEKGAESSTRSSEYCRYPCLNGGTCVGTRCQCRPGYHGEYCAEPHCKESCLNGGRCVSPDRCACAYGYTGRRCEAGQNAVTHIFSTTLMNITATLRK